MPSQWPPPYSPPFPSRPNRWAAAGWTFLVLGLFVAAGFAVGSGRLGFFVRFGRVGSPVADPGGQSVADPGGQIAAYQPPLDSHGDPRWVTPPEPLLPATTTAGLPAALTATNPTGPVVTPAMAQAVVSAAWALHGQALAAGDENLMASMETGSALEADLGRCGCPHPTNPFGPIGGVSVMVPRQTSYPARFMAQVATTVPAPTSGRDQYLAFVVFTRTDPATPWRITLLGGFASDGAAAVTPPAVDADGYLAIEAAAPKVDPAAVHDLLADYWRRAKDSGTVPDPGPFEPGVWTTHQAGVLAEHHQGEVGGTGFTEYYAYQADPDPASLFVFDQGLGWRIACAPVRVQRTFTGGPGGFPYQTPDLHNWGRDVPPGVHAAIIDTELTVPCIEIPAAGSADGLRVYGADEYTSHIEARDAPAPTAPATITA